MDHPDRGRRFRESRFAAALATGQAATPHRISRHFIRNSESMTTPRPLTPAFEDALVYATRLHAGEARKASDTPYVSTC